MQDKNVLHLCWSTILKHEYIVEKQTLERPENCDLKLAKIEDKNSKHQEKVNTNRDAVFKVLKAAKEK
jgi:hypothetical protein